jgi:hypothetical protein
VDTVFDIGIVKLKTIDKTQTSFLPMDTAYDCINAHCIHVADLVLLIVATLDSFTDCYNSE